MTEQFFTFTIERFHSLGQEKGSTPVGLVWTPTWPLFHCFGTLIWRTLGHGKMLYMHMLMFLLKTVDLEFCLTIIRTSSFEEGLSRRTYY